MANTYVGKVNAQGKVFVKKQASVLSKSLLVAGIAFILIFAFSFGLFSFLEKKYGANVNSNVITILYVISIVCLIATLIMCFVVSTKINKCKLSTIITMIALYGIANGICFGLLFYAIQHTNNVHVNMSDILYCFLITGCVFAVSGIVGTLLSVKFTLTLGKFLLIATLTFFLVYIILMIVMIFSGLRDSTYYLIWGFWGLLMIGYIMFDFSVIKKSQAFMDVVDSNTQRKFVFMFGFMLLVDLIQLLWVVIRIFILSRS